MHGIYMWPDHRNTQAPKNIDIHVSKDGQNWTLVGNYTLPNVIQRHTLYFDTTHLAKYFKITIHTVHAANPINDAKGVTRITEIGAF